MPVIMGATEVLDERKLRLLLKHYELQAEALNEVAEAVALHWGDADYCRERIDDVIDTVRSCNLTNPNGIEDSREAVEAMEWQEPLGSLRYELPK